MIKFTKMHGIGNDYIYINTDENKINNPSELSINLSNRHFGIGSDGLILISKSEIADFKMQMFNSDGSEGNMCGNGIRCASKFVWDNKLTNKTNLKFETKAGIKETKLLIDENGDVLNVTVKMGRPEVKIKSIRLENTIIEYVYVNIGNEHAVVFTSNITDIDKYGEIISKQLDINVEFANIIDSDTVEMRVYERGSGETLACGTGACATAVASIFSKNANLNINVILPGGNLNVFIDEDSTIYMTGTATTVFEGEIDI